MCDRRSRSGDIRSCKEVTVTLEENPEEYFYGGGVQTDVFLIKAKSLPSKIRIVDDGGGLPCPFLLVYQWLHGMMWYTFRKGEYDFGATEKNIVKLSHNSSYLDIFYMVNDGAVSLLNVSIS